MRIWMVWLGGICGMAALAGAAGSEIVPGVPRVACRVPQDLEEWTGRRADVRRTLGQLLGALPPRPARPAVRVIERTKRPEGFTVERIEFDNGAGALVPGLVCLPEKIDGRAPAILYCHQHAGLYGKGGKQELFERRPTPIEPAADLTRRGYVVLAIDAYCFGERSGRGPLGAKETGGAEEMTMSKLNLWLGRTLWGMIVRDDLLALDYLAARPDVDPARIGVTGFSMGSTRTWWITAMDERPRAAVCVCCLTRYQDLIDTGELRAHGIYYFVPGLLRHFDTEAVVALTAPRPMLTLTGDQDGGSPIAGVNTINAFAGKVYALYGKGEAFRGVVYPGLGHEYTPEMWRETTDWFARWL